MTFVRLLALFVPVLVVAWRQPPVRSGSSRGSKAMAAVDRALHIAFGGGVTGVQRLMVAAAFAAAAWVVAVSSAVSC